MEAPIRVLMITNQWPALRHSTTHFIKRQSEFLRAAGVDVDVYHFKGQGRPWRYVDAWVGARQRLSPERYDLVHAQFGQSGLLALPKRLPLVVTLRGSDLLGIVRDTDGKRTLPGRALQWATRAVARRADAVVVVSEHMKAQLPSPVPVTVIPSGIDLSLFRPMPQAEARRRLNLPPDAPLVLFVGRPTQARKRFAMAKEAVEILRQSIPAELIVGWGVPHTDMPLYMNAADALVFTSMQEGSPNVVKEALACELPVVSVPVGDVPERLREVEGCELCTDARPEAIAAALGRVLIPRRRAKSRAAVLSLDETLLTSRLIEVYRSVLERAGHPRRRSAPTEAAHSSVEPIAS